MRDILEKLSFCYRMNSYDYKITQRYIKQIWVVGACPRYMFWIKDKFRAILNIVNY